MDVSIPPIIKFSFARYFIAYVTLIITLKFVICVKDMMLSAAIGLVLTSFCCPAFITTKIHCSLQSDFGKVLKDFSQSNFLFR